MKTHQQKWKKGIQKNWIENSTEMIELANRNRRCAETTPDYHWHDNVGCSSAATKYGKLEMRRSQHTSTSSYGLLFVQHKIWFLAASIRWWMLFMLVLLNAQRCALCFSLSHWLPFPASHREVCCGFAVSHKHPHQNDNAAIPFIEPLQSNASMPHTLTLTHGLYRKISLYRGPTKMSIGCLVSW